MLEVQLAFTTTTSTHQTLLNSFELDVAQDLMAREIYDLALSSQSRDCMT